MLTNEGCRSRTERLRGLLGSDWDAAVIHKPEHLLYLANFFPLPNSLNLQSSSFLLIERNGPSTLFTDNWLKPKDGAAQPAADDLVAIDWYTCRGPAENRALAVGDALRERIEKLRVKLLAAELGHLPCLVSQAAPEHREIEHVLREMREIKDADELEAIRRGIRTAEAMHGASRALLRPGLSEIEYYGQLLGPATVAAGAPFVMMCDVASGPRAAEGGGAPTPRVMGSGELVILDLFPYVEGYRGDITNTLVVGGKPAPEQEALFSLVLEGLEAGETFLGPGAPVREIHASIDAVLRDTSRHPSVRANRMLAHHAGHAIGLCHPEAPELVPDSDRVLAEGMVVTLEPGVYGAPTGGVRVEHNYLITSSGFERLSSHELGLA